MKYFLPDSQDLVDPSFDFATERRSATRLRQRDDLYIHELFDSRAVDGLLVSKGIVDGIGGSGGRYTLAQRHRLLRDGAPDFFRLENSRSGSLETMGDCGAFTYIAEEVPPYSVEEVFDFYVDCQFDYGMSVDHVILEYEPTWDHPRRLASDDRDAARRAKARQQCTLDLAAEFLRLSKSNGGRLVPVGVAQGWSPGSYASAVKELQKMGYAYIAVGGMVPLKTTQVVEALAAVAEVRAPATKLHLLGVTRLESLSDFVRFGVASFDSTSPLRQAFKDDKDNYYTPGRTYTAVRIPQVEGNPKLERTIRSGKIGQGHARELERACLDVMHRLDRGDATPDEALFTLTKFDDLFDTTQGNAAGRRRKHLDLYREVLTDQPWKACPCNVCRELGYHVILFRGAERNRRRGLHNVWTFYRRLQTQRDRSGASRAGTQEQQPQGVSA